MKRSAEILTKQRGWSSTSCRRHAAGPARTRKVRPSWMPPRALSSHLGPSILLLRAKLSLRLAGAANLWTWQH